MTNDMVIKGQNHKKSKLNLFRYLQLKGVSPADFYKQLQIENKKKSGLYLSFLFSTLDSWYPASDNRSYKQKGIRHNIPILTKQYSNFIKYFQKKDLLSVLYITNTQPQYMNWFWKKVAFSDKYNLAAYVPCRIKKSKNINSEHYLLFDNITWSSPQIKCTPMNENVTQCQGDQSRYGYQLVTNSFKVRSNELIYISINFKIIQGSAGIGIMNSKTEKWILPPTNDPKKWKFFSENTKSIKIVLANQENSSGMNTKFLLGSQIRLDYIGKISECGSRSATLKTKI